MSVMDKFLNYMKLNDDDEDDYYDDDYMDDDEIEEPAPKKSAPVRVVEEDTKEERPARKAAQPKVTPIRQNVRKVA